MQPYNQCKRITSLLFCTVLLLGGTVLVGTAWAQTPPIGKLLYEKLAKTQQEYREAMATGDSLEVAEMCYRMGKRYIGMGDYLTAQNWFIRSLRIREPLGMSEDIGKIYLRMAEMETQQKKYPETMNYARQALANFSHVQSRHGLMGAYIVLAGTHELGWKLNREKPGIVPHASLDSTLYYFRRAEQLALTLKKPYDIANVYACMGRALILKDANQAIPYLKKAYAINHQSNQPYILINLAQQLAKCYLMLGQSQIAKKWLDEAIQARASQRFGDYWQNRDLEETYTNYYQQTDQWKQAFTHQHKYYMYYINALNADREGAISRIEMLYENEKKEIKLKAQQQELKLRRENLKAQQRVTVMTTLLLVIACMASVVFYWLFRKYQRISGHNAKLVKEQNHRVKNNLQSITNLLGLQFNQLTDAVARRAVEESLLRVEAMALVHQRLYDGDRLVEVNLGQYIPELVGGVLRSFDFGDIKPQYNLDPIWLDADVAINVGLLLNELVTNSCKYAFPFHPNPRLEIGCQQEQGQIQVWVSDNGPGFTWPVKGNSFGMKLIDMIIDKLKGKGILPWMRAFILRYRSSIEPKR